MNKDQVYEDDILASFEKGEWQPAKNQKKANQRYQQMAAATLSKNRRVNIRISAQDLERLQARAAEEGLPYQTLMASVLHKYVSLRLVDATEIAAPRAKRAARKRVAA